MGRRRSVYLSDQVDAELSACGRPLPEVIRAGLDALAAGQPGKNEGDGAGLAGRRRNESRSSPSKQCPPHPGGRVHRGLCGACGRNVGNEKIS